MTNGAVSRVEQLRVAAQGLTNQLQYELAPYLADDFVEYEEYDHDYRQLGVYTRLNVNDDFRVFKVRGLRYYPEYNHPKKKTSTRDTLENMVKNKIVYPFLLFINDSVVKWSRIEILKDYELTYLLISGLERHEEVSFNIIEFPCNVRYGEDDDILPSSEKSVGIYFDRFGHVTLGDDIRCRLEVVDDNIFGAYQNITVDKPYITFDIGNRQTTLSSIICFTDGILDPEGTKDLKYVGWNAYANLNPDDYGSHRYLTFYNKRSNLSVNHQYTPVIDQDFNKRYALKYVSGGASYLEDLFKLSEFNFSYDKELSFEENIKNALTYIMDFDANLINDAYKKETSVFTDKFTGQEVLDHAKNNTSTPNTMTISRKRCGFFDNDLILFINGEESTNFSYRNNLIDIPTRDIKSTDKVDMLFVPGSKNTTPLPITIEDEDTPIHIMSDYDLTKCRLFTNEKHDLDYDVFKIDPDGRTQFELEFTCEKHDGNMYYFHLEDEYFYGRSLTLVQDDKMVSTTFTVDTSDPDTDSDYYFLLPTEFNYCHGKNHYLVFLNGQMLTRENFTITEPKTTRPFDKMYLYITTHLIDDDRLDVYYMPTEFYDEIYLDKLDLSGDVVVDASELTVPLSSENYLVFVNGKKIFPDDIINISRNKLRIKSSYDSINNVLFIRYHHKIEEIESIFKLTKDDEWSRYIDSLYQFDYNRLINNTTQLKPTESVSSDGTITSNDYQDYHYPLSTIVSDIVFDYYMKRAGLKLTDKVFVYDFELDAVGIDTGCETVAVNTTDSSRDDKMYQYWYNSTDEELEGVTFDKSPVDNDS